jgi:hypothetical protein
LPPSLTHSEPFWTGRPLAPLARGHTVQEPGAVDALDAAPGHDQENDMPKVTYLDPTDDAPKVTWMGVVFRAQVPTDVSNKELLDAARMHPHFKVEEDEEKPPTGKATWPDEEASTPKKGKK